MNAGSRGTMGGWCALQEGVLRVTGKDSRVFLHNLLSCNIKDLQVGQVIPGAYLNATGRLLAPLWCWGLAPEEFALQTPLACLENLTMRLERYIFREEVQISLDPGKLWQLEGHASPDPQHFNAEPWGLIAQQHRTVLWSGQEPDWAAEGYVPLSSAASEQKRILQGIPAWGKELDETLIPLGLGLDGAFDHNKGCYTGQEVISRLTFVGHAPHQLWGLKLKDSLSDPPYSLQKDGETIGIVTSCITTIEYGPIALARIRWQRAIPGMQTEIVFEDENVSKATVCTLPFTTLAL